MELWKFAIFDALASIGGTLSSYVDEVRAETLPGKAMKFFNRCGLIVPSTSTKLGC